MAATASFKLVGTAAEGDGPDDTLKIERRGANRKKTRAQATATFIEPDGRLWLTRVSVVDESEGGLGVRCPVPVTPGATFALSMQGATARLHGAVVHARGRGGAYRLGLQRTRQMAA